MLTEQEARNYLQEGKRLTRPNWLVNDYIECVEGVIINDAGNPHEFDNGDNQYILWIEPVVNVDITEEQDYSNSYYLREYNKSYTILGYELYLFRVFENILDARLWLSDRLSSEYTIVEFDSYEEAEDYIIKKLNGIETCTDCTKVVL